MALCVIKDAKLLYMIMGLSFHKYKTKNHSVAVFVLDLSEFQAMYVCKMLYFKLDSWFHSVA